jgi:hypothetical protein
MTELRDRYFNTLGLQTYGASAKARLEAALARAYPQRSFEIEHYWKRATYFWGFQVAIFAAFGLLWRATNADQWTPITVAIAALGFLTGAANSASARGSKFWQENWECHIDMLEDAIEGRLYKTVWLQNRTVQFSVSRVNVGLSDCIVGFWILISVYVAWQYLGKPPLEWSVFASREDYVLFVAALTCLGLFRLLRKTDLRGTITDNTGNHGEPWQPLRRWRFCTAAETKTFVRRYAPDEYP